MVLAAPLSQLRAECMEDSLRMRVELGWRTPEQMENIHVKIEPLLHQNELLRRSLNTARFEMVSRTILQTIMDNLSKIRKIIQESDWQPSNN